MLSKVVFLREMAMLADRFGRDVSPEVIGRYFDTLRERLSTEEFEAAARFVFDHDSFWPSPARFVEVVRGNAKEDAEREWQTLVNACSRGDRDVLLSPEGAAAMRAAGGWNAVAYAGCERDLAVRRREFITSFTAQRDAQERAALPTPVPPMLLDVEARPS
jgi:hypothetical protein